MGEGNDDCRDIIDEEAFFYYLYPQITFCK